MTLLQHIILVAFTKWLKNLIIIRYSVCFFTHTYTHRLPKGLKLHLLNFLLHSPKTDFNWTTFKQSFSSWNFSLGLDIVLVVFTPSVRMPVQFSKKKIFWLFSFFLNNIDFYSEDKYEYLCERNKNRSIMREEALDRVCISYQDTLKHSLSLSDTRV